MKASNKLRAASEGQPPNEATRFKELWRKKFSDEQKAEFLDWFNDSKISNPVIRKMIAEKYGIKLNHDSQLSRDGGLRDWCLQELSNATEAEWAAQEEEDLKAAGLSGEQLRDELLNRIKRRALVRGDHKLGLAVVDRDLKAQALTLDREKFEFDAAKAALTHASELKSISSNNKLSEPEKVNLVRQKLFGVVPTAKTE